MNLLKMSKGNKKLSKDTLILSLPAGRTCPGANNCKSFVEINKDNKRILKRGNDCIFTCESSEFCFYNVMRAQTQEEDPETTPFTNYVIFC